MRGKRLYGKRFTVVGKQANAFNHFRNSRRFMNCAAHLHSSLLTPHFKGLPETNPPIPRRDFFIHVDPVSPGLESNFGAGQEDLV